MSYHHVTFLNNQEEVRALLAKIGVDDGAYPFLLPKGVYRHIVLKAIPCRVANIIKQEMLSKGGEAAVSKEALYGEGHTDVLLMGTLKQYRLLVKKLRLQPLGLKQIAGEIEAVGQSASSNQRIGVVPRPEPAAGQKNPGNGDTQCNPGLVFRWGTLY